MFPDGFSWPGLAGDHDTLFRGQDGDPDRGMNTPAPMGGAMGPNLITGAQSQLGARERGINEVEDRRQAIFDLQCDSRLMQANTAVNNYAFR